MDQRTGVSQLLGRLLINPIFVISGYAKLAQLPYVSMCFLLSLSLGAARYTVGLFTRPAAVVLGVWCVATAVVATAIGCTSR
jgi:uncharacterized membrane protein YphA (DoxX/SURF4 family)